MTWLAALIVAVCAGVVWTCTAYLWAPNPRSEGEDAEISGLAVIAGIALAVGLWVTLVAT